MKGGTQLADGGGGNNGWGDDGGMGVFVARGPYGLNDVQWWGLVGGGGGGGVK